MKIIKNFLIIFYKRKFILIDFSIIKNIYRSESRINIKYYTSHSVESRKISMINKTSRLFKRRKITIPAAACSYICHTRHLISTSHVITRVLWRNLTPSSSKIRIDPTNDDVFLRQGTSIILLVPSILRTSRMKEKHANLSER